ncbi:MAG: RagB/SusD family nutrient uptake outer membrane protein [Paludibacteraceae bacterium]|nr:RagB/SusD family nutrient uptake outer membrane protein [Paludibacteraceae bacterium]
MKKNIKSLIGVLALTFGMSACMNLDPIDPNSLQMSTENQAEITDALYSKLYCAFVQTGQQGGGGNADIITNDEGYCGFYRTLCVLNEFPTDAGWWTWRGDDGCSDLLMLSWTPSNQFISKLYNRLNYAVTMSNHYLDLTEGATDAETIHKRAEIRFIRALNYYHLLDMFGNVPFTVTISTDDPHQIARADLYEWLVDEIVNGHSGKTYNVSTYKVTGDADHGFINDLYDRDETTLYRVTKPAANMLLARLYLNAEVYTGTAHWAEAEAAAKEVIAKFPTLHGNYAQIFMGDNDKVAREEMVFLAACDGDHIRSYAGSQYTIASCRNSKMNGCGSSDNNWGCWRSSPELIEKFGNFHGKTPAQIIALGHEADEFAMPAIAGDDRAMFCAKNINPADGTDNVKGFWGNCPANGEEFDSCWAICKWTNKYSMEFDAANQPIAVSLAPQHDATYMDTDVPIMRTAEAYLTLAEAQFRQGNTAGALENVNKVRARAHAALLTSAELTADELCDEWLREFYHEGRRRIDLIRFGQFVGPTATRNWEGRSGDSNVVWKSFASHDAWNTTVASIPAYMIIYPIPETDVISNPNVKQNEGYK